MAKTAYNIQPKGYVGGADFDHVIIDWFATGLSISAAFKQHGNVCVHFISLNASAATIGSCCASDFVDDAWRGPHQH